MIIKESEPEGLTFGFSKARFLEWGPMMKEGRGIAEISRTNQRRSIYKKETQKGLTNGTTN